MTNASEPVLRLWRALAKRDWEAVKTVMSDDCIYVSMPFGPKVAVRGPDNIVKWIKLFAEHENLAKVANRDVLLLTNGVDVMYEHVATWTSKNGETSNTPMVSVHKVTDDKVAVWKEYFDLAEIFDTTWTRSVGVGDANGMFDATDLIF